MIRWWPWWSLPLCISVVRHIGQLRSLKSRVHSSTTLVMMVETLVWWWVRWWWWWWWSVDTYITLLIEILILMMQTMMTMTVWLIFTHHPATLKQQCDNERSENPKLLSSFPLVASPKCCLCYLSLFALFYQHSETATIPKEMGEWGIYALIYDLLKGCMQQEIPHSN